MNILIIPSWYPSSDHPSTGIFFREQAHLYARTYPDDRLAIVHWGPHEEQLLLPFRPDSIWKLFRKKPSARQQKLAPNLTEYFEPAYTWTRRLKSGNLSGMLTSVLKGIDQFEKAHGPVDLIHAHVAFPAGYLARVISEKCKVPYLITEHMTPIPMEGLKWRANEYVFDPLKSADQVLAVSEYQKMELMRHGIKANVLGNYIDDSFFSLSQETKRPVGTIRFLTIGRLETQKGHEYLIQACKWLKDRMDFTLEIIGEGSEREKLETMIHTMGLANHIRLVGEKSQDEVKQHLHQCDVFVFPSLFESFGIAPLEALACGKPIIATPVGEVGGMIHPTTGLEVAPGEAAGLSEAMHKLGRAIDTYDASTIRAFYEENYSSSSALSKLRKSYTEMIS